MSIEGQGHFFTIYFPGFVCFVLYLAKISGERLQDHWSSGSETIEASDLKIGRNRHLNECIKVYEYWRSRSFLDLGRRSCKYKNSNRIFSETTVPI